MSEMKDTVAVTHDVAQGRPSSLPWRTLFVVLALSCLGVVGWVSFRDMGSLASADQWEKHTYEVLLELEQLMSAVKDAETGQRGYLLTGNEAYLEPYTNTIQEIGQRQATLLRLTADNPSQQKRLAEVANLIQERLRILEKLIELRRTQGQEAAMKVLMMGQGKVVMDSIREHVAAATAEEERLLGERTQGKIVRVNNTVWMLGLGGVLGGSVILGIVLLLQHENARRRQVADELERHKVNLESLIQSRTAELRRSESRLKTLIEHAPAALAMFDRDMHYLAVSRRWLEDYRVSGNVIGKSHYEVFPETTEAWREAQRRGLAGAVVRGDSERFERLDGSVQYVSWEVRPWHDESGAVGGVGIFAEDVTERVQALDSLKRSQELLRLITDTAPALISYVDTHFRYRQTNLAYEQWFGVPVEEIFGQTVQDVIGDAAWSKVGHRFERATAGEAVSFEEEVPYRVGGDRWVSVNLNPDVAPDGQVRGIVILVIDITDRKRAEHQLVEQRHRLAGIVDSAMDAIISIDATQRIALFNKAAEAMFQCSAQEAIGTSIERFIPGRFRANHASHVARFGRTGETSRTMGRLGNVYGVRSDGREFPIEASISQIEIQGEKLFTVILRDISTRLAAENEIRRMTAELEARVEARTAELKEANRELETFAYAVSHDLRAPLRAISGFTRMLGTNYSDCFDDAGRQYLEHVIDGARRMGDLIEGLLQLSRSSRGEFVRKRVDLSGLANKIVSELAAADPGRKVRVEIEEGLEADGDPRMLEALLRNLLDNAWKYSSRKEEALIRFHCEGTQPFRFCISDNGAGFDMAHAEKLFEPFRRLHKQGEFAGIGIGLATVQRIVHRHGGEIAAEAMPGEGAIFCFTLQGQSQADRKSHP